MQRLFVILVLTCCSIALISCGGDYKLKRDRLAEPSPWPYFRGDIAATGATDGSWNGRLNVAWQHRTNSKPAGPLTLYHGLLFYPGTKNKVEIFELPTGKLTGKVKIKGHNQAGLIMHDSLAFYALGPKKNRVEAVNLVNQKDLWDRPVKDAAAGTIVVNNSLIVGSATGRILALDLFDGSIRWQTDTEARISTPASAGHGLIFQPVTGDQIVAVTDTSGEEQYRVDLTAPVAAPVAVGDLVYAGAIDGAVTAFRPSDGTIAWSADVGAPIWTAPALDSRYLIIGHSGGEAVCFDAATGRERWRFATSKVLRASPRIIGPYVVVGSLAGELFVLTTESGDLVDSTTLRGAVASAPVTDGRRVIVATDDGRITCFGESDEDYHATADQRIDPQDGSQ
jgi:outer membrane protein assembly factor BamB